MSLQEQKDAIERHAHRNGLEIVAWYEERETAAKRGRPIFTQMLQALRKGSADGVVIHKIDRSARNLKDWADLGDLIDFGVEVQFANEGLDLQSRGGRLSADIQAVVAADYIRNLREETRKGFYGRLKQGLYPLPAPLGYVDKGKGQPKEPDPLKASLVKKAFELYASGGFTLDTLRDELFRMGLRRENGTKIPRSTLADLFKNPFYIGLIQIKRTKETFAGIHQPLVSKSQFDRVQQILSGKCNARTTLHSFLFRRMLHCRPCGYSLVGEEQKGHVYYRCHASGCGASSVREERIEGHVMEMFSRLQFGEEEKGYVWRKVEQLRANWGTEQQVQLKALTLALTNIEDRLYRLTDAYIDRAIDKELFEHRKTALLMQQKALEEQIAKLKDPTRSIPDRLADYLELAEGSYLQYQLGLMNDKRDLLKTLTSNRAVDGKTIDISFSFPFNAIANRFENAYGGPYRTRLRTWDRLLGQIMKCIGISPTVSAEPLKGV